MKLGRRTLFAIITLLITIAGYAAAHYMANRRTMPKLIAAGTFHQVAHKGKGFASIYQYKDGRRVLSFTQFITGSGKDLQVYMITAADALENDTVKQAEFISLGDLQSSEGDQTYALPETVDLTKYRAVTIWSRIYEVNFTTAPLTLY